ncbi:MAG: uncharacterized protein JWQ44_2838 [Chthoniobacter sp.]|nr:uncharacterized protein [Chthoniobacter sp.]
MLAALMVVASASGAELHWGAGGAGGSGTWNESDPVWWDGTNNVVWKSGDVAVFGGTPGTVTSSFPRPTPSVIVFNVAGYTLSGDWIIGSPSGLTVTTNADATISATLSGHSDGRKFTKNGPGVLTVTSTNFFDVVEINAGEYRFAGDASLPFSDLVLADAPGVLVTVGGWFGSVSIGSLSGGGPNGGVVQPNDQPGTLSLRLWGAGTFNGRLQDNGSGKLSVIWGGLETKTLTGVNTHSGETSVSSGTLALSGNGSALNSPVSAFSAGTIHLDNSAIPIPNRISDTLDVTLTGGTLALSGHGSMPVEEMAGTLKYGQAAKVAVTESGLASARLRFSGASRVGRGTLDVTGSHVRWEGASNEYGALVGPYVTARSTEWATVDGNGWIAALNSYATSLNAASMADDVKITGGGVSSLASAATRNSLNLQNSSDADAVVDLAGHALTLTSGGLLTSGTRSALITGGTLRSGSTELVVTNRNALSISSGIAELHPGTVLTKSGAGVLTLTGNNTYTGNTAILEGALVVTSDASLGLGAAIEFSGGTLVAGASFSSAKTLTGGSIAVDTAGHDITLSGRNLSLLSKQGAGTLSLSNPHAGLVFAEAGTLVLPNASSGRVYLQGGTLRAQGTLDYLELNASSRLDIGGPQAATLTTHEYRNFRLDSKLTLDFGIGATGGDLWVLRRMFGRFGSEAGTVLFDFEDLGGLQTGTRYSLIQMPPGSRDLSVFALAPNLVSEGWEATFSVSMNTLGVQFSQVPEPTGGALLFVGLGAWALRPRRGRPWSVSCTLRRERRRRAKP